MTEYVASLPGLQTAVLWACALAATAVFALMIHSIATFRRIPDGVKRERNSTAEVFWALVPILIVGASATPALTGMLEADPVPASSETAQQTRPAPGPELAGEIPQKPFQDGPVPL